MKLSIHAIIKAVTFLFLVFQFLSIQSQTATQKRPAKKFDSWNDNSIIISGGAGGPNTDPLYYVKQDAASTSTLSDFKSDLVFHFKAELALTGHFGLAVTANRSTLYFKETYIVNNGVNVAPKTTELKLKVLTVNLRANYHFLNSKIIDPYIGVGAGLRKIEFTTPSSSYKVLVEEHRIPFGFEATLGIRFLIAGRAGIFVEAGAARSILQGGISINFGRLKKKTSG